MTETAIWRTQPAGAVNARVAIVEDHGLLAESLAFALSNMGIEVTVVDDLSSHNVLTVLAAENLDLVLLDFDLGDAGLGLDLVRPITDLGLRVVMLTGETSTIKLAECVEAGAIGIISKSEQFNHLIDHVTDVVDGRRILSPTTRERLLGELRAHRSAENERLAPFSRLTVRESEVLKDLMAGKNAETIATEGYVSVATVRSHIKALLAKLGVNSQLAAVAAAQRAGWPAPPAA